MSTKLLSIVVPCYNSEAYMTKCIDSLVVDSDDRVEVLIVNDGSSDQTASIANAYAASHPRIVRALHQENRGHGGAVNTGLAYASGRYFKVVDSDDWVDRDALRKILQSLASFSDEGPDLVVTNFVYEKARAWRKKRVRYRNALPRERVIGWDEMGKLRLGQYLMMHSMMYRTQVLRDAGLQLPNHTFYVDNLYVFLPLPQVRSLYYIDADFYRYYVGREDQSVNGEIMVRRIDQQLRVNRIMIDCWAQHPVDNESLRRIMSHQLEIVTMISSILAIRSGSIENLGKKEELWRRLRDSDATLHDAFRRGLMGRLLRLPGAIGRDFTLGVYHITQRVYGYS